MSTHDNEINRAMAEAAGWTEFGVRIAWGLPPGAFDDGSEDCLRHYPYYITDLNAVHEVIYKLGINDRNNLKIRVKFITCVRNVVSRRIPTNKVGASLMSDIDLLTVKSNEFCEAILKTLNKWNPEWNQ
jgi:hypothetical protein